MNYLITNTPILSNTVHINFLLGNFPIGLIILEKELFSNQFKLIYSNKIANNLFDFPKDKNINKINTQLKLCKEHNFFINNNKNNLFDCISNLNKDEIITKNFTINEKLIFVKIKKEKAKFILIVDDYDDERKSIQQNFIENIGYNYLYTLYHEINNPLNSLISIVDDIFNTIMNDHPKISNEIEILIMLIKVFIKNFILYFKLATIEAKKRNNNNNNNSNNNVISRTESKKSNKLFGMESRRGKIVTNKK